MLQLRALLALVITLACFGVPVSAAAAGVKGANTPKVAPLVAAYGQGY